MNMVKLGMVNCKVQTYIYIYNIGQPFFPQQQNFAMGSLAQMSSGAIRCSFNTRFRTRFRRDLVKIPAEAPEGSVRFWRVSVQIPCEVPEGSGERPCEVPEGFGGEDAW